MYIQHYEEYLSSLCLKFTWAFIIMYTVLHIYPQQRRVNKSQINVSIKYDKYNQLIEELYTGE